MSLENRPELMHGVASPDRLMEQAPDTAHVYLLRAVEIIDGCLGKGYAKKHPELIAAYLLTCAVDCGASMIARAIQLGPGSAE